MSGSALSPARKRVLKLERSFASRWNQNTDRFREAASLHWFCREESGDCTVLLEEVPFWIFSADCPERSGGTKEAVNSPLFNYSPKSRGIGSANRLPFIDDGSTAL